VFHRARRISIITGHYYFFKKGVSAWNLLILSVILSDSIVHNFILNVLFFDIFNFANRAEIALQDEISRNIFKHRAHSCIFFNMRRITRLQSSFS